VHAWRRARPADRVVVIDAMTYATNIRRLEPLIADRGNKNYAYRIAV